MENINKQTPKSPEKIKDNEKEEKDDQIGQG